MEQWRDIEGYKGLYKISSLGNVVRIWKYAGVKEIKPHINNWGYKIITLSKNHKNKTYILHRLVAKTFIPNPDNLPQVNHIDGNKTNNNIENLEWCSMIHNIREAYRIGLNPKPRAVNQFTKDGKKIKTFISASEAARHLEKTPYLICKCCRGVKPSAYGFVWRYANER